MNPPLSSRETFWLAIATWAISHIPIERRKAMTKAHERHLRLVNKEQ